MRLIIIIYIVNEAFDNYLFYSVNETFEHDLFSQWHFAKEYLSQGKLDRWFSLRDKILFKDTIG